MAAGYRASAAGGSNVANTVSTATITPAVGDLFVVFAAQTGGSSSGANVSDNNADAGSYTKITEQTFTGGVLTAWIRSAFINNTTSTDVSFGPGSGSTANELVVIALSSMRAAGTTAVRQSGVASGAAASTPALTLGASALTFNVMLGALADTTNPPGVTGPAVWTRRQDVGQAKPLGLDAYSRDSGFTGQPVTWGSNSSTDWGVIALELYTTVSDGVDMGSTSFYVHPRRKESAVGPAQTTGYRPASENPMMTFPVKQSTSITIPVFMRDKVDGSGLAGLTLAVQSKKYGAAFATIAPTQVDRGNGWYDVTFTSGMVDTLGPMPLHITAGGAFANDENIIKVVAVDDADAVRFGMSALPNATIGTPEGIALYEQVQNIAVTGAALNIIPTSRTITTGTETGSLSNANTLDGVFHNVADSAGVIDFYYQFDVSATADAVGVGVQWAGYVVGLVNTVKVYAWNWGNSAWDQVGSIIGIAGTLVSENDFEITSAHTSAGLARIRFSGTGLVSATVKTDRILFGYTVPAAGTTAVSAIKAKTDFLPSVAAGSNTGLPVVGTQIPNATAGANGGLPLQGGAIPNANAGAVGGVSTITAIGQGPGGVLKPNSMEDNMVYSSSKLTSSRLRVFATSAALASAVAGHADNADGEVERYVSAVTYNVDGTVASFKWTKQL